MDCLRPIIIGSGENEQPVLTFASHRAQVSMQVEEIALRL